jgi:hypothetical protein
MLVGREAALEPRFARRHTLVAETGHSFGIHASAADVLPALVGSYSPVAAEKRVLLSKSMRATTKRGGDTHAWNAASENAA